MSGRRRPCSPSAGGSLRRCPGLRYRVSSSSIIRKSNTAFWKINNGTSWEKRSFLFLCIFVFISGCKVDCSCYFPVIPYNQKFLTPFREFGIGKSKTLKYRLQFTLKDPNSHKLLELFPKWNCPTSGTFCINGLSVKVGKCTCIFRNMEHCYSVA